MILYKYLGPDRVDVLESQLIRFTQPDAFNDPFESNPCFDSLLEADLVDEICQPNDCSDPDAVEQNLRFKEQMKAHLSSSEVKQWKIEKTVDKIAILCLSSRTDSVLMWSHYADSHQGFVVGFETAHTSMRNRKDGERHLLEVRYTDDRPRGETLEQFSIEQLFCTKSEEWTHEREWRLFDRTSNADSHNPPFSLFRFSPEAVRVVILGARTQEAVRARIAEVLARPEYVNAKVWQAGLHPSQYRVELREAPPPK